MSKPTPKPASSYERLREQRERLIRAWPDSTGALPSQETGGFGFGVGGSRLGWVPAYEVGGIQYDAATGRPLRMNRVGVGSIPPSHRQINQYPEGVPSGPVPAVTPPAVLGGSNVPIRTGAPNRAVELARQQAEQQARLEGQYRSPGFWKSDDGAAMMALANQAAAPKERSLADYYGAQRAVGIGAQDEIVAGLTQGLGEQEAKAMKAWASENPALALREYNKRFPAGEPAMGPTPPADADLATAAGQEVRENMRRLAENQRWNPAGAKFVDRSGLPASAAPSFIPAPTAQAVAAADGLTAFSGPVVPSSLNFEQALRLSPVVPPAGSLVPSPLPFDASAVTSLAQNLGPPAFTNERVAEFLEPWLARARR